MSNTDKKQPPKKSTNSYSLLLKSLSDAEKSKPQNPKPPKKSSDNNMSEKRKTEDKPSSSTSASADVQQEDGSDDPDIPDRSYGDYYCKICDSHMNSDNMWDAHVTGKRHIKNVKKGDTDSKYDDLPDEQSTINYELEGVKVPVVGLSYIHEIRRKEPNVPPIYNCFLCHASIATAPLVTEHVISLKHRFNYVKENDPDQCQLIEATNLKKGHMEPLVIAAVTDLEQKYGRGTVKVKQEKKKSPVVTYSAKKSFNAEDAVRFDASNSSWLDSSTFWKPVDGVRNYNQRDRSRSPRDFEDILPSYSRNRSPKDFRSRNRVTYPEEEHTVDSYRFGRNASPRQNDYERSISISPRRDDYGKKSSKKLPRQDDYDRTSANKSFRQDDYNKTPVNKLSRRDDYDKERSRRDRWQVDDKRSRQDDFEENISFTKRDMLPHRDDYNFRNSDAFAHSSRKSDPVDKRSLEYEHTSSRDLVKKSFNNHAMPHTPISELNRETIATSTWGAKSIEDGINYILPLGNDDCYKLILGLVKRLPDITRIEEMLLLTKIICEMQKKLKSKLSERLIAFITDSAPKPESSDIPAISMRDAGPSTELRNMNTPFKSSTNTADVNSFIKSILQSANMSPTIRPSSQDAFHLQNLSYPTQPTINSQQAAHNSYQAAPSTNINAYQVPSGNTNAYQVTAGNTNAYQVPSGNTNSYQVPSGNTNSYQASSSYPVPTGSYQAQPASSYTNVPFASGSTSNYSASSSGIPGIGASKQASPESQMYKFSHYTSSPSSSKNYPRKY